MSTELEIVEVTAVSDGTLHKFPIRRTPTGNLMSPWFSFIGAEGIADPNSLYRGDPQNASSPASKIYLEMKAVAITAFSAVTGEHPPDLILQERRGPGRLEWCIVTRSQSVVWPRLPKVLPKPKMPDPRVAILLPPPKAIGLPLLERSAEKVHDKADAIEAAVFVARPHARRQLKLPPGGSLVPPPEMDHVVFPEAPAPRKLWRHAIGRFFSLLRR